MKITPLNTKVLIQLDPEEEVTQGGIILADVAKRQEPKGTVLSIGPEVTNVAVGQRIMFGKYAGYDIGILDTALVDVEDVLCIISEEVT